jgi:NAD(P)-dependent dehydrogenase (short-subunit alcohol dehydrogenase family)
MAKLTGKIALITGGTTGIGRATAELFHAEGATVIVTGANDATITHARTLFGNKVEVIKSDAASITDIVALVDHIKERYGHLDILFVNAGVASFAPLNAVDEALFDRQFNINVRGAFFLMQKASAIMTDGGTIIITSSIAGVSATAMASVYSATKAAVRAFGRSLAGELAPRNIRVNTISPGPIDTPIFGKFNLPQEAIDGFAKSITQAVPLKRFGQPSEIAKVALFFASDDSSYVTGTELFVDGGIVEAHS